MMTHNDVLRSLRYVLNATDATFVDIVRLGGAEITRPQMMALLKAEDDAGFEPCTHRVMAHFLNGLVIYKRGKDDTRPPQPLEVPVTNNAILKKLRAAFELKDTDILALLEQSGLRVSKTELGAFFRRPDHRNYRDCGDQLLRYLLKGLAS